ncbi:fimbria/pilus outer membrane usher protein [Stenotrophomonas maltophilia]|uniref:fimbria/pilus outer membrane usher protein n=1 Tax=Stenotrophomonas maltophilia TaxID=40324 RepID=UPI0015DE9E37|nr:fimbria/pilus outer membrane usher protein [Stenotrophomonas maltophilia]MBA0446638.1 fimbrial biogenesis outer membrane usher protein [Stenotrophomonas maltophilia]
MIPRFSPPRTASQCRALSVAIAFALYSASAAAAADDVEFSNGFLIGGQVIDMQRYAHGNPLPDGDYPLELLVNDGFQGNVDIGVRDGVVCLPTAVARRLDLKDDILAQLDDDSDACVDLPRLIEGATVAVDSSTLQLRIGLPQAAQARRARGYVAPDQRDRGITAGFFDYSLNHNRSGGRDSTYLGVNAGLNLGAWRLRHRASISHGTQGRRHDVIGSTLQRDLPGWNSQLLLGESNTGGELFESVAFTGLRVATDERMLPDSLRGFAPVVRGIAEGNAVVRIRQNGNVIHETTVAPGPFVIEDLYPTHFGGDLEVTVTEPDGREQRFDVNFSAVPQALRPGASRFSATVGQLRDTSDRWDELRFAEATYARGISNRLTVLGGAQLGEDYRSVLAGAAVNTPVGAFGADITHSRAQPLHAGPVTGNSFRINYQRYVARSGTNFGLAAYRYSTRGYLSLGDFARVRSDDWGHASRARQRYQMNFSQKLGQRSTLYLSGGHTRYWDSARRQNDMQLGVQTVVGMANIGLSALRYQIGEGRQDTRYALTLSLPLGRSPSTPRLSSQVSHAATGTTAQLGVNGVMGEDRALSYSLSASDGGGSQGNASAYAAYQGSRGNFNAGYSRSGDYRNLSLGASGSVALHRGGMNLGPPVGEGFALIHADGAQGARVGYGGQVRVSGNGYALLPHVSPYRWNQIDLDPSGLPIEVDLLQTSQRFAPTAGSIVRVEFGARRERTLFIDATDALGQPLPFAARVEDESGTPKGAVGQGGVIQLRGAQDAGALIVDPDGAQRCRLEYRMPDAPDGYGLSWSQALCVPLAAPLRGLQAAVPATP